MRMQYALHSRSSGIDASMNWPLRHSVWLSGLVDTCACHINDDQALRFEFPPTNRARLNENAVFVEPRAEMATQPVPHCFCGIQHFARLNQFEAQGGPMHRKLHLGFHQIASAYLHLDFAIQHQGTRTHPVNIAMMRSEWFLPLMKRANFL